MRIEKVEKDMNLEFTKIHISHNRIDAYYILQDSLQLGFEEELQAFMKTFFNEDDEVSWSDCMDYDDVYDVFSTYKFLKSEEAQHEAHKREEQYLAQTEVSK